MELTQNHSLKNLNTFGIDVKAKQLYTVSTQNDLKKILKKLYADEIFVFGGGSNILLIDDLDSTVLHMDVKGISVINESQDKVIIKAMAGEKWHQFVQHCIDKDYGGWADLLLIAGNVGTATIQDIGGDGGELQDYCVECKARNRQAREIKTVRKEECNFGCHDSRFKNDIKGQYRIISVDCQLSKN